MGVVLYLWALAANMDLGVDPPVEYVDYVVSDPSIATLVLAFQSLG